MKTEPGRFEEYAAEKRTGLLAEFLEFLKCNRKWWFLPILFVLLGVGGLMLLTSSAPAVAPFLYTLF